MPKPPLKRKQVNVYVRLREDEVAELSRSGEQKVTDGLRQAVQAFIWLKARQRRDGWRVGAIAPDGQVEVPVVFDL